MLATLSMHSSQEQSPQLARDQAKAILLKTMAVLEASSKAPRVPEIAEQVRLLHEQHQNDLLIARALVKTILAVSNDQETADLYFEQQQLKVMLEDARKVN